MTGTLYGYKLNVDQFVGCFDDAVTTELMSYQFNRYTYNHNHIDVII